MIAELSRQESSFEVGRAALRRGAWADAIASLAAVVDAEPDHAAAWEALAIARMWVQQSNSSIEARQQAYALYRERGDDLSSARVALELIWDFLEVRGEPAVANGWYQRARRLLEPLEPAAEHALLRIWDAYMVFEEDPAAGESRAREAGALAEQVGAADVRVLALALQGVAVVSAGRLHEGMSLLDEAVTAAVAREITDPQWYYFACCCMIDACDQVRDFTRSLEWCHRLQSFAERWNVQAFLTTCRIKYSGALLWRGDWQAYEAELAGAITELSEHRPGAIAGAAARLAELRRRQGRRQEAESLLEKAGAEPLALATRAALALDAGDAAAAIYLIEALLRRAPHGPATARTTALELKTRAHSRLGQVDLAAAAAAELQAIAATVDTPALRAAALSASGLAATAATEHERARCLFEDAAAAFEFAGSPYEAARSRLDLAESLAALGRSAAARAEATSALSALAALGAAAEASRARALLNERQGHGPDGHHGARRRDGRPGILTRRQREVLAFVAQGLSDREIAERLFLSEHTVHRHVANILGRLGVSSRSAAVAHALRAELL